MSLATVFIKMLQQIGAPIAEMQTALAEDRRAPDAGVSDQKNDCCRETARTARQVHPGCCC